MDMSRQVKRRRKGMRKRGGSIGGGNQTGRRWEEGERNDEGRMQRRLMMVTTVETPRGYCFAYPAYPHQPHHPIPRGRRRRKTASRRARSLLNAFRVSSDVSWKLFGGLLGRLGGLFAGPVAFLSVLGASGIFLRPVGVLGASWELPGNLWGASWGPLGGLLGPSWASWSDLWVSRAPLLAPSGGVL